MILSWSVALALEPMNLDAGVAVDGYDVVAYFEDAVATAGSPDHVSLYGGATWRFASAEHRAVFEAEPERFVPRFGGYCAWAVSQGRTADIDPTAWTVVEGALYLNYSPDIQAKWRADTEAHIALGEANWPKLLAGELPAK